MSDGIKDFDYKQVQETTAFQREKLSDAGKINWMDNVSDWTSAIVKSGDRDLRYFQITMNEGGAHLEVNGKLDGDTLAAYQKARAEFNTNGIRDDHERDVMIDLIKEQGTGSLSILGAALKDAWKGGDHNKYAELTQEFKKAWNKKHTEVVFDGKTTPKEGFTLLEENDKMNAATRTAIDQAVAEHDAAEAGKKKEAPAAPIPKPSGYLKSVKSMLAEHQQIPQETTQVSFNGTASAIDKSTVNSKG